MSDLVVFVVIVAAVAGVGIALGMIVAGRIDRLLAPRPAESTTIGPDASTSSAPQEEQS